MWRRVLLFTLMPVLALFFVPGLALADTATSSIAMQGQAAIIEQYEVAQLRLKASASGDPGWLLEVSLNPTRVRSDDAGHQVVDVNGSFTLGTPSHPLASGKVTGSVDSTASGDISLSDSKSSTSLDVTFSIASDGAISAQANGQWPALPGAAPQPSQPANHFFWYLSRTSGLAAYILLFVSVCLGLMLKSSSPRKLMNHWQALDIHQLTAMLSMGLILVHIFSLLGDSYFSYNLAQLLIPFASPYRQLWTAVGVLAFYLSLAMIVSLYMRKYIGQKIWRVLHSLSWVLFLAILLHSAMSGTDTSAPWGAWLYIGTGAIAAFLFLRRYVGSGGRQASADTEMSKAPVTSD